MVKRITLLSLLLISAISFAQYGQGPIGHLTIFSEDGDKFQLVLNGELQNDTPQTNLRIEDLNQPYYNAKIQFEDKTLLDISKNNLLIADADGVFQDVTYKIKRDKNNKGKMKLNFFSMIPVRQGYIAPSNVYVVHYGQSRDVVVVNQNPPRGVVNQTTTTTTTQTGGTNIGVGVNVGGINMGVSINDTNGGAVVSQTTTTTTQSSSGYTENNNYDHQNNAPRGCSGRYCMDSKDFANALNTVKNQGFDETRLKTAKQIASANCLNVNQIVQIATVFGFEESKLDFAKFAYDYCIEPKNYFNLNNIFSFSTSVDELTEYIQTRN